MAVDNQRGELFLRMGAADEGGRREKRPQPGECDSRIAEENAGIVAIPSVQGAALQNNV
jgi:hypothetical protein